MTEPPGWAAPDDRSGWAASPGATQPTSALPGWAEPPPGWSGPPPGEGQPPGWGQAGGGGRPPGGPWGPPPYGSAPPKPGIVPLRPLTVSDVLDGAFATMRQQPRTVFTLSAIVAGISLLFSVILQAFTNSASIAQSSTGVANPVTFIASVASIAGLSLLVQTIVTSWLLGMLTVVVTEAVLGRRTSPREAWRRVRSQLVLLAVLGVTIRFLTDALGIVIVGFFLSGVWALAIPALVMEHTDFVGAFRRSWRLAAPDFWRVWGIRLIAVIIAMFAAGVIVLPVEAIVLGTTLAHTTSTSIGFGSAAAVTVVAAVANLLTLPFPLAVQALLYVDRRMRAEGLDIALARASGSPTSGVT